jgi:hypothetical protein
MAGCDWGRDTGVAGAGGRIGAVGRTFGTWAIGTSLKVWKAEVVGIRLCVGVLPRLS